MLQGNRAAAAALADELTGDRQLLEAEGDAETSRFLKVLQVSLKGHVSGLRTCSQAEHSHAQGMLNHTMLREAGQLTGMHAAAFGRMMNQARPSSGLLLTLCNRIH